MAEALCTEVDYLVIVLGEEAHLEEGCCVSVLVLG